MPYAWTCLNSRCDAAVWLKFKCLIPHPKVLAVPVGQLGGDPHFQFWFHPRRCRVDGWWNSVILKYGVRVMKRLLVSWINTFAILTLLDILAQQNPRSVGSHWSMTIIVSHSSVIVTQPQSGQAILNFVSPVLLILMAHITLRLGSGWRQETGPRIFQEPLTSAMHDVVLLPMVTSAQLAHSKQSRNLSLSTPLQNIEH